MHLNFKTGFLMKKLFAISALLLASISASFAQNNDALYQALGQKAGLSALMDDFMVRLMADARLQPFFKETNQTNFKTQLADQLCQVSGGPCAYKGADMKSSHSNMDINKTHFNALVEVLQLSMDAKGIAFSAQNQLLARLAPMNRDIITVK
jgi:hemoglobin